MKKNYKKITLCAFAVATFVPTYAEINESLIQGLVVGSTVGALGAYWYLSLKHAQELEEKDQKIANLQRCIESTLALQKESTKRQSKNDQENEDSLLQRFQEFWRNNFMFSGW